MERVKWRVMDGLLLSSKSEGSGMVCDRLRIHDKCIGYGTGAAWNRRRLELEGE